MKELAKAYEPSQFEEAIYERWEESGFFNPDVCLEKGITSDAAETFSMVLPPPNVTGTLHMGHAVMLAVQDVMTRYHRMKGDQTLWIPGTDHAAVATESKVEKLLISEEGMDKPKETLGRDAFLERVRQFAAESHDTIVNQAKHMGASLDWSREAFTLDDERSLAVRSAFKTMYDDGLIYRGYRVINWSVVGQSTCSDDELVHVERQGMLYTFQYSPEIPIPISTTRPETKLGDTAIAVHPEGKWKEYIGKSFTVEHFGQDGHTLELKVIGDEQVDDAFGTGALGVTPAHSPIDFEMYQAQKASGNDIGLIQVIGEDGRMTANAGTAYEGKTVEEARVAVVEWLREQGLLQAEEETMQNVGTSDRFGDVVEPLPKTQWFVDVNKEFTMKHSEIDGISEGDTVTLKKLMQHVVRSKQIQILPERFEKTYFHWIDNLRDWCISRQIWYGHQIPVWYNGDEMHVGVDAPEGDEWTQDPDTLDTWFSSGLWTFSTLGWPNQTTDLKTFHPTTVLETGYDILFFWVARMILMSTYLVGQVPFENVYLHGLVRDEQGRKMSKSLGNIIDPLDMNQKYGTDATRLSLLIGGTPGNDMKLSEEKIAGFRNFTNKVWNISRFVLMNIEEPTIDASLPEAKTLADQWILSRLNEVTKQVTADIEQYRFSAAGETLREFTWTELADWYLEIAKIEGDKSAILNYVLNTLLKLWHPYMPYVTEAIWNEVYGEDQMLMVAEWPRLQEATPSNLDDFELVKAVVSGVRALRAEYGIAPAKEMVASIVGDAVVLDDNDAVVRGLARLSALHLVDAKPDNAVGFVVGGVEVYIDLAGAVDVEKEKVRIEKEIAHVEPFVVSLEKKLGNSGFVDNAPAEVIEQETQKLEEAKNKLIALKQQYSSLGDV